MIKPRLCDCLFCVSLILWSGFWLLVCVCDFYWIISWFLWMGFWFGVFLFIYLFIRILKFQRVAHNVFNKLLVWLCIIKLTWVCAASHCVVVSLFVILFFSLVVGAFYGKGIACLANGSNWDRNRTTSNIFTAVRAAPLSELLLFLVVTLLSIINDI